MDCRYCKKDIPEGSVFCNHCGGKQERVKGVRRRGNGMGTVEKTKAGYKAVVVVGWKESVTETPAGTAKKLLPVRRTKGGFKTKKEALQYIPTLAGQRPDKPMLIEELYTHWKDSAMEQLSKSQQDSMRIAHDKLKAIHYTPIKNLRIEDLQAVVDEKAKTHYPARDIRVLLSHLYKRAVAQGEVPTNLAEFIVIPKLQETEQTPFSEAEISNLWADYTQDNLFTGYILLMIYSGMMPGELLGAQKSMVDWERGVITGAGLKTNKRKKSPIVVGDVTKAILQRICDEVPGKKLIAINKDNFYKRYYETLERCGCRKLPPYSCRHTTATALALQDVIPSVIQEIMRHTKFATTQRYIHVDTTPMRDAINQIEAPKDE